MPMATIEMSVSMSACTALHLLYIRKKRKEKKEPMATIEMSVSMSTCSSRHLLYFRKQKHANDDYGNVSVNVHLFSTATLMLGGKPTNQPNKQKTCSWPPSKCQCQYLLVSTAFFMLERKPNKQP